MIFEENQIINERVNIKPNKFKFMQDIIRNLFDSRTMPYMLVLFLLTSVSFLGVQPLAFVMLGAATIFNIPLMIPFVISLISFCVFKSDTSIIINYITTYILYIALVSVIDIEGFSKKYTVLIKLSIATLISSLVNMLLFSGTDNIVTKTIIFLLSVVIFYPIITSGLSLFININKNMIFSKEEIVSFGILITLMLIPFVGINVVGFSIVNVILTVLTVIIAWKNDWLVGTTTGMIVGLIYCICTSENSLIITSLALSGLISGLLNKHSKVIVIIAFMLGNFALAHIYLKDMEVWGRVAEMLIASGVILALPRKLIIKLEDLIGNNNILGRGYENQLGASNNIKDRLNAMSEVFDNLSHISTVSTEETKEETTAVVKKYLEDYKKNECISCKNKFNCLSEELDLISKHIAERLEMNKPITKEMIPVDCELSEEIINNIQDIYSNIKLMRVVKQKESESNLKLAEEYKTVSTLIKNMSQEVEQLAKITTPEQKIIREELKFMGYVVYEDVFEKNENDVIYEFITDILVDIDKAKSQIQKIVSDVLKTKMTIKLILNSSKTEKSRIKLLPSSKYVVNAVVRQIRKADSPVNGDSYIVTELKDNSKIIAISDGMGSGVKSKEISSSVINMIEKMNSSGLDKEAIVNIINKVVKMKENSNISATLDMCNVNEKNNVLEFIKLGAVSSFVILDNKVNVIKQDNMPIGLQSNVQYNPETVELHKGMFVILISDGAASDINENVLQSIVETSDNLTEKNLIDKIMEKLVGGQNKIILDDITVIVCKIS